MYKNYNMRIPVYPKIGQLCQIKQDLLHTADRHWSLQDINENHDRYKPIWLTVDDMFLVIKIIQQSMWSLQMIVLYENKIGMIRIGPENIVLVKAIE